MPYLALDTNAAIPEAKAEALLQALSACLAEGTGKPESVVQVKVAGGKKMLMAKTAAPTAYLDVKGIGLPEASAKGLAALLTGVVGRELGIPANRVYITFASFPGTMWGVGGGTFG